MEENIFTLERQDEHPQRSFHVFGARMTDTRNVRPCVFWTSTFTRGINGKASAEDSSE